MRRAFTLTEVLVSTSVITLLIALALPTLSSARKSSKNAKCLSNLSQVSKHTGAYYLGGKEGALQLGLREDGDPYYKCPCDTDPRSYGYEPVPFPRDPARMRMDAMLSHYASSKIKVARDTQAWHGWRNAGYLDGHAARE